MKWQIMGDRKILFDIFSRFLYPLNSYIVAKNEVIFFNDITKSAIIKRLSGK